MTLEFGTVLNNRYRIVGILGQGGMGSVYRAFDENLGVSVAVKEILFLSDEYARQFRVEAKILASLRHPNLPRVGDHFVIRGQGQYLVMDYIEGDDLRQVMDRAGKLSEAEVIKIGISICDALIYLHSRQPPVIHRDIKPGNVKITPEGEVVLVDFGLAKILLDSQATTTGARAMTPGFSPPEQYGTARTDARTDIYSLGATLYVALTGRIPEDGLARATSNAYLTEVRQHNPQVSAELAAVIEKAMALQPEDRWQTALDFKDALEKVRDRPADFAVDVPAEKPSQSAPENEELYPMQISSALEPELAMVEEKPARQRRFPWALVVLLLLAAFGAVYFTVLRPDLTALVMARLAASATQPVAALLTLTPSFTFVPSSTPAPRLTATPDPSATQPLPPTPTPTLPPTATFTATPAPTLFGGGSGLIAYVSESSGVPQIWLMNPDGSDPHALTSQLDGACQPDWSPDGRQLVFISPCTGRMRLYKGASLYQINSDGSDLKPLAPAPEGDFDPRWSPDGRSIVFTSLRNGHAQIFLLQLADKTTVNLSNDEFSNWQPAWSPDGASIAYVSDRSDYQIWLMDADGKNKKRFAHSVDLDDLSPAWTTDGQFIIFSQMSRAQLYPWLMGLRVVDSGTPKEFRIPANWQNSFGYISSAEPSPDGLWIAFENWNLVENTREIYIMTFNGGDSRPLTKNKTFAYQPVWQPAPARP